MNSLLWLFTKVVCSPQDVLYSDWQRTHPAERYGHKRLPHTERGESVRTVPYWAGWRSGNASFKMVFLSPSKEIPGQCLNYATIASFHDFSKSLLINYPTCPCYVLWNAKTVLNERKKPLVFNDWRAVSNISWYFDWEIRNVTSLHAI
jgi:hypothetical protein